LEKNVLFKYFFNKAKNLVKDYLSRHLVVQRTEDRGLRTEDRGRRTEDRVQKTDDRGRKPEVRRQVNQIKVGRRRYLLFLSELDSNIDYQTSDYNICRSSDI
jgi:hypothetical protein